MSRRIAVLGGGLLGVCTALELARRGQRVTLVEGTGTVLDGASRWNEGKIHLGFLYAADPSLSTAARLIPGGLAFAELVTRLVGRPIDACTVEDDVFLVHRDSVVDADAFAAYGQRAAALLRDAASAPRAPRGLSDSRSATIRRMSPKELAHVTISDAVVAGFHVPERSVSTVAVADALCARLREEPLVETHVDTWVTGVRRRADGRFDVQATGGGARELDAFDAVVNALWEGRPAVDATLGFEPPAPWTHRFRAAVFGHAPRSAMGNGILCVGPFGDVKRYSDGRVYLSWYPRGLIAEGHALEPPRGDAVLSDARRDAVARGTIEALAQFFPHVSALPDVADALEVRGGWVYAMGQGSLADRESSLHRRDRFDMIVDGGYISVDTAKYSLAPWLADRVAELIVT